MHRFAAGSAPFPAAASSTAVFAAVVAAVAAVISAVAAAAGVAGAGDAAAPSASAAAAAAAAAPAVTGPCAADPRSTSSSAFIIPVGGNRRTSGSPRLCEQSVRRALILVTPLLLLLWANYSLPRWYLERETHQIPPHFGGFKLPARRLNTEFRSPGAGGIRFESHAQGGHLIAA